MAIAIPLERMSVEEKIQAMGTLWNDLRACAGDALSPAWHGSELSRREAALARREETSEAWGSAKDSIRKTVR